ncbi:MAG TPA: ECF-type sigma factor [Rubricoccaceae bacterium]
MPSPPPDVTRLLVEMSAGNEAAADTLLPLVYAELLRMAHERLRHEREGHTLATVDLVHEAYLRLVDGAEVGWQDRAHFFAVASSVMRRLLVDWARARRAAKRGDGTALSLDAAAGGAPNGAVDGGAALLERVAAPVRDETLIELDEALTRLTVRSARQARVVECRYFGGLTIEETAEALGVSPSTVKDDWRLARAWLTREMTAA